MKKPEAVSEFSRLCSHLEFQAVAKRNPTFGTIPDR
jgi:hypothetical protein